MESHPSDLTTAEYMVVLKYIHANKEKWRDEARTETIKWKLDECMRECARRVAEEMLPSHTQIVVQHIFSIIIICFLCFIAVGVWTIRVCKRLEAL